MNFIDPQIKLKRYLYLCSENPCYVANNVENEYCKINCIQCVSELIKTNKGEAIIDICEAAGNDKLCRKRETVFFVLALCARVSECNTFKCSVYNTVSNICRRAEDLFHFIKFTRTFCKTFGNGVRRIVKKFYLSMEYSQLASVLTDGNSYCGWSHRDIIKLCHVKPQTIEQQCLFQYIFKETKDVQLTGNSPIEVSHTVKDIICKLDISNNLKHCQSEAEIANLIRKFNFGLKQIPRLMQSSLQIWEALVSSMEIPDLLEHLPVLRKLGYLVNESALLPKIIEIVTNSQKCRACKLHPVEVLIELKKHGKGSRNLKKENEFDKFSPDADKCSNLRTVLYKLLDHSFMNVCSTGLRIMITVEVGNKYKNNYCIKSKTVKTMEAAAALALSIMKAEPNFTLAAFNGRNVIILSIDKSWDMLEELKNLTGSYVSLPSTCQWALDNGRSIDVFLNLLHCVDSYNRTSTFVRKLNPVECLKNYRNIMNLPQTKMITVCLGSRSFKLADGSPYIFDICGFDKDVPKIIEACCKEILQ